MVLSSGVCYQSVSFWRYFLFLIQQCNIALGHNYGVVFIVSHACIGHFLLGGCGVRQVLGLFCHLVALILGENNVKSLRVSNYTCSASRSANGTHHVYKE